MNERMNVTLPVSYHWKTQEPKRSNSANLLLLQY